MQRRLCAILYSRARFFFPSRAISSLEAVDFGPGCRNQRIKSRREAMPSSVPVAGTLNFTNNGNLPEGGRYTFQASMDIRQSERERK